MCKSFNIRWLRPKGPDQSRAPRQVFHPPNRFVIALYRVGLGPLIGRLILLLTTTGRKTGLPRVTPLQYEEIDGTFHVAAARGQSADWFRNILADPRVHVRVKSRSFRGIAQPVTDPNPIVDFLELRLHRHPRMIGAILRSEGLPPNPSRAQLEDYARKLAMVVIYPEGWSGGGAAEGSDAVQLGRANRQKSAK